MKILLVDDDDQKAQTIVAAIKQTLGDERLHSVTVVTTLAYAVRVLSLVAFDLIVLDLMLPYVQGGAADSRAGLELLRQLRFEEGLNKATAVIGISSFPEEVALIRTKFEELGVVLTQFDDEGTWSRMLVSVLEEIQRRSSSQIDLDFLVFCALEEERAGFAKTGFVKISNAIVSGLNVQYVELPTRPGLFGAVVRLSQTGLVAATFETALALNAFRAKALCMSGICAGFSNAAKLGQLVIASPAWEYQAGKWSANGFEIAPMQVPLRPGTRSVIDQAIARDDFIRYVEAAIDAGVNRPPQQHPAILAPFATGSAVIADSQRLDHIKQQHRKVAALDMETFGLYFSAHESISTMQHFFSVKCVVDLADSAKSDDLHAYGCIAAARATERLLSALLLPSDG